MSMLAFQQPLCHPPRLQDVLALEEDLVDAFQRKPSGFQLTESGSVKQPKCDQEQFNLQRRYLVDLGHPNLL